MIKQLKYQNITWTDLSTPTPEEVSSIAETYNLHPLLSHELESTSSRSKADLYDSCIYLILKFPTCTICLGNKEEKTSAADSEEIDFIIGKDFLITTHYASCPALEELATIFETGAVSEAKGKSAKEIHAGHLFFSIIRQLYQSLEPGLEFINAELRKVEGRVFTDQENENVKILADINHDLLDFRWALKDHKSILASLEAASKSFFGEKFEYYLKAIIGEYEKIWNSLESSREYFADLRDTNDSLLSIKTNRVMKNLTIMAFVTFPLTLIAALFGMDTAYTPIVGHPHDFWVITGLMLAGMLGMFWFFKHRKWM